MILAAAMVRQWAPRIPRESGDDPDMLRGAEFFAKYSP